MHALKKRDRAPGRSGRPLPHPLTTRLTREETDRVKAHCLALGISRHRWLGDLVRAALAGIKPDDDSRAEISLGPDWLPGAGMAPRIDHDRRREREEVRQRTTKPAGDEPEILGHDLPTDIW